VGGLGDVLQAEVKAFASLAQGLADVDVGRQDEFRRTQRRQSVVIGVWPSPCVS
jgi:hypothetical protein